MILGRWVSFMIFLFDILLWELWDFLVLMFLFLEVVVRLYILDWGIYFFIFFYLLVFNFLEEDNLVFIYCVFRIEILGFYLIKIGGLGILYYCIL